MDNRHSLKCPGSRNKVAVRVGETLLITEWRRYCWFPSAALLLLLVCAATRAVEPTVDEARRRAAELRLFGVEIGGPEDGCSLTDRSKFESAKRVGARSIDVRPIWAILEPRPGVFDWSTLDAGIGNAASVGLPVTVTLRFFDQQIPAWLADENMLDQEGRPFYGYSGEKSRTLSYWGPQARQSYLRLVEALVRRYRANPAVLAWQFFYGFNDSFYLGMWAGRETVYDYSRFSQEKYRYYLSRVKRLSLGELNKRYGTTYRSWTELVQPKPTFGALNVTLRWHDFQDYRMWSIERMFDDIDRTVRRLDARPLIMYYGGSLHFAAHQLSVYDVGLRLLRNYGGALDITCFEDPVPAEVGAGFVRQYGVPLMAEAWQVPPPLADFRRLLFHAFALGVKSYQMVGNWEKMAVSPEEFRRTGRVFLEMAESEPVRAPVAGLFSYRSILSYIPARSYINPTLAMIPQLQQHQYSLDWHSDLSSLEDLHRYPALLDANSEVLARPVIELLGRYVEQGGRLVLLNRSGRYALEDGHPDYPLLVRLHCPKPSSQEVENWSFGKGYVTRVGKPVDWQSPAGVEMLLKLMEWLHVDRPITATAGVLAAVSRGRRGELYAALYSPAAEARAATFALSRTLLQSGRRCRISNLFDEEERAVLVGSETVAGDVPVSLGPHELKVLKITLAPP